MNAGHQVNIAAELACSVTTVRFFHFLDRRNYDAVAALLTADGTWVRQGRALAGPEAVLEALRARPAGFTTRHLLSNIVVDLVSDHEALVGYELSVYTQLEDESARLGTIMTGEDTLRRTEAGWRIHIKKAKPLFSFPG